MTNDISSSPDTGLEARIATGQSPSGGVAQDCYAQECEDAHEQLDRDMGWD